MDGEMAPETLRERISDGDGADGDDGGDGDRSGDGGGRSGDDGNPGPLVVDIRSPADFAEGHLPGSLNVPLADLPGEIDRIARAEEVVTVCPHGKASVKAARIVGAYRDFDGRVLSLAGGLEAWDGPLESGGSDAGDDETGRDGGPEAPF